MGYPMGYSIIILSRKLMGRQNRRWATLGAVYVIKLFGKLRGRQTVKLGDGLR